MAMLDFNERGKRTGLNPLNRLKWNPKPMWWNETQSFLKFSPKTGRNLHIVSWVAKGWSRGIQYLFYTCAWPNWQVEKLCSQIVRSFVNPSIRPSAPSSVTKLVNMICWKWMDWFWCLCYHKWSTEQRHDQLWSQEVKGHSHTRPNTDLEAWGRHHSLPH